MQEIKQKKNFQNQYRTFNIVRDNDYTKFIYKIIPVYSFGHGNINHLYAILPQIFHFGLNLMKIVSLKRMSYLIRFL